MNVSRFLKSSISLFSRVSGVFFVSLRRCIWTCIIVFCWWLSLSDSFCSFIFFIIMLVTSFMWSLRCPRSTVVCRCVPMDSVVLIRVDYFPNVRAQSIEEPYNIPSIESRIARTPSSLFLMTFDRWPIFVFQVVILDLALLLIDNWLGFWLFWFLWLFRFLWLFTFLRLLLFLLTHFFLLFRLLYRFGIRFTAVTSSSLLLFLFFLHILRRFRIAVGFDFLLFVVEFCHILVEVSGDLLFTNRLLQLESF